MGNIELIYRIANIPCLIHSLPDKLLACLLLFEV